MSKAGSPTGMVGNYETQFPTQVHFTKWNAHLQGHYSLIEERVNVVVFTL